jgi:hypothetical protein
MEDSVEAIADRLDLDESEVLRRLVRLGLQDVEEIGDEVLMGAVDTPDTTASTP